MSDTITTVAQLIEILKTFPADLPVLVSGYESGYECFYHPEILKLVKRPENMYYDGEYQIAATGESPDLSAVVLTRVLRDD
jgi:hypothetical protein